MRPRARAKLGAGLRSLKIKLLVKKIMKTNIHPKYYEKTTVRCACGNTFQLGSTKEFIEVEICSKCHPFYTGKEKIIDALGRVEKFRKKLVKKEEMKGKRKSK